jgi:hypothetical protein
LIETGKPIRLGSSFDPFENVLMVKESDGRLRSTVAALALRPGRRNARGPLQGRSCNGVLGKSVAATPV